MTNVYRVCGDVGGDRRERLYLANSFHELIAENIEIEKWAESIYCVGVLENFNRQKND